MALPHVHLYQSSQQPFLRDVQLRGCCLILTGMHFSINPVAVAAAHLIAQLCLIIGCKGMKTCTCAMERCTCAAL